MAAKESIFILFSCPYIWKMSHIVLVLLSVSNLTYSVFHWNEHLAVEWLVCLLIGQTLVWTRLYVHCEKSLNTKVVWISLVFAAIFIKASPPVFEDDFYRYYWDGVQTLQTGQPYRLAPEEVPYTAKLELIRDQISYADHVTIYPPLSQLLFAGLVLLSGFQIDVFLLLLSVGGWVVFILCFDRLLRQRGGVSSTTQRWGRVLLVAQHPLLLREWLQASHFDSWIVALLVLALSVERKTVFVILMACLPQFKVSFLVLCPLLKATKWLQTLQGVLVFLLVLLLTLSLFGSGALDYFNALHSFSSLWEMNSGLFRWLREGLSMWGEVETAGTIARVIVAFLAVAVSCGIGLKCKLKAEERAFWILLVLVLVSPVANSWYFSWFLPLTVFFERSVQKPLWWMYSFLPLSYCFYQKTSGDYSFLLWWNVEHLGVWSCVSVAVWRRCFQLKE